MTDPVDQSAQNGDPIDAQFEPAPPSADHVVLPDTPRKGPGWIALIATGVLASLVGAGIGSQFGPVLGSDAAPSATGNNEEQTALIDTLSDDQKKLGSRIAALQADLERAENRLADQITDLAAPADSTDTEDLSGTLAALSARVDLLSSVSGNTETGEDLGPISARMLAFEQALANIQTAQTRRGEALANLTERLETVQAGEGTDPAALTGLHEDISAMKVQLAEVAAASAENTAPSNGNAALAMLSLEAASERGDPFTDVMPALEAANADAGLLEDLRPIAPLGAPTLDKLENMFYGGLLSARALSQDGDRSDELSDEGQEPDGWGWVRRTFGDSVKITRSGESASEASPNEALERVANNVGSALGNGNLTGAMAELDALEGDERDAFAVWIEAADRRVKLDNTLIALRASLLEQER